MAGFSDWIKKKFDESPAQMTGALTGFVCAILMIGIGFWNTILVVFLTAAGFSLGCLVEHGGDIHSCLEKFRGKRHD